MHINDIVLDSRNMLQLLQIFSIPVGSGETDKGENNIFSILT